MPALTITKTYANGNTLFGADLDNAFNSITTFLNTTLIDSANVQVGGLIGTNLANGTITSSQLSSGCIGEAQLASSAVTSASIAPGAVQTANIASSAVTGAQLNTNLNFSGKNVLLQGQNAVCSANPATNGLLLVRGAVNGTGSITSGEGFTVNHLGTGNFIISMTNAFLDIPAVIASPNFALNGYAIPNNLSSTGFTVSTHNNASGLDTDFSFSFLAIGQRS